MYTYIYISIYIYNYTYIYIIIRIYGNVQVVTFRWNHSIKKIYGFSSNIASMPQPEFLPTEKWVWVKIRYPNNWMVNNVNTQLDIHICGPTSVFHFDPHPNEIRRNSGEARIIQVFEHNIRWQREWKHWEGGSTADDRETDQEIMFSFSPTVWICQFYFLKKQCSLNPPGIFRTLW